MNPAKPKSALTTLIKVFLMLAIPVAIILVFAFGIPKYYYDATDWLALRNYTPSQEIKSLAEAASLSERAKKIFYTHDPKIQDKQVFNSDCPFKERTYVLGCYDGENIFILKITEKRLAKTEVVTAAHETLHAAYQRLQPEEKQQIDSLLREALDDADQRVIELVEDYEKADSSVVPTELHSIIGTEVRKLDPKLEDYYSQYFKDRQAVVSAFQEYEDVFSGLEEKADRLQSEITSLRAEKTKIEKELNDQAKRINSLDQQLKQLERQEKFDEYNALVPDRNNLANSYNANLTRLKAVINSHNQKVKQKNSIATEINDLLFSLDSKQYEKI